MVWTPTWGALQHRNFRLYFAGNLISVVGWWMHQVAQPWLVLVMTDSAFFVGLVSALGTLPVMLFSLYGGVVADRFPKRTVIIVTQTAAMVVALSLAAVVLTGVARLGHVMLAATLFGVVAAFDIPGRQAFLVEMVGKRDLMNAIALNSSAFNASRVVGPGIGGVLIGLVGVGMLFLLNGLSYLAVLAALFAIQAPGAARPPIRRSPWSTIGEGLRHVSGDARMRTLIVMIATASIFGFSFQVVMPVFVRETLGRGAVAYGWMVSAAGVGALVGALCLATFGRQVRKGSAVSVAAPSFGVFLAALGLVRSFPLVLTILMLIGLAMIVHTATTNTLLQTLAPDDLRGRVLSVYTLAFVGLLPIGALWAGTMAERFGPPTMFVGGGVICLGVSLVALQRAPALRRIE